MIGSSAIIDSSLTVQAILTIPRQGRCRDLIGRLHRDGYHLVAPMLWIYETSSAISEAVHFEQLTRAEGELALQEVADLGVRLIEPDVLPRQQALAWTLRLKRAAAYDSYYLALAEMLGCDLWTADSRLINVVNLPWVRTVGDGS